MNNLRIIYMGTPDFAVAPLRKLIENNQNVVAVITSPDKKAGRGQKTQESAVKKAAIEYNIPVLQPANLKCVDFLEELKSYNANLQIVVAFRMLPKQVWQMPEYGTFNLHASLLPNYRGAAPINWAVINGETETGVTTFFINEEIDTGSIIFQEKISISETETVGIVHDKLMNIGANLVVKTVLAISDKTIKPTKQEELFSDELELKPAPKIFKEDCKIDWSKNCKTIYNFVRGFSPYPGAWCNIYDANGDETTIKLYWVETEICKHNKSVGEIVYVDKKNIKIACSDGYIIPKDLQLAGKKRMTTDALLQGLRIDENWKCS